jgi:hypothetical protein
VGGNGNDTYIIDASDTLIEAAGAGTDTVRANFSYTLLANFENLILTGAASINGTGNSVANRITGNGGANTLVLAGSDVSAFSFTTNTLRVNGNAGDTVATTDAGWLRIPDVMIGAQTYAQYTNGAATLQVDVDANRSGIDVTVSAIALSSLNGTNGFRLDGIDPGDKSGISVAAAGDVNGDGFDDLIIGAHLANPDGDLSAGESYVVFGRDFTGTVTHLGSSEADSMTGTAAAQTFVAGQGSDTISGGGGADVFNAGEGNDQIRVSSTAFADTDGGSGHDTLAILGGGRTLNLTTRPNNELIGIETIDLTGSGANTLKLSALDLLDLSDTTNQLNVDGNAGDTVDLDGTWTDGGEGATYHTFTLGEATILIDNDIFVT